MWSLLLCGLFSSWGEWGFSLRWLLLLSVTSSRARGLYVQHMDSLVYPGLLSTGSIVVAWVWLLCGMWDLAGPGIEPMSPTLAGGFFSHWTTGEAPGYGTLWAAQKIPMCCSFPLVHLPLSSSAMADSSSSLLCHSLFFFRTFYKWNHSAWNFFETHFFHSHTHCLWDSSELFLFFIFIFSELFLTSLFPFDCHTVPLYGCTTVCIAIHLLKDIAGVSSLGQLWIEWLCNCRKLSQAGLNMGVISRREVPRSGVLTSTWCPWFSL